MQTHMRPRKVRAILHLAWLTVAAAMAAALILAPKSHAQVDICGLLAANPTITGVENIALGLMGNNMTGYDAGRLIASSAMVGCPEYLPLLREFAGAHSRPDRLA